MKERNKGRHHLLSNGKNGVAIDLQEDSKEVSLCHFKFEMFIVY